MKRYGWLVALLFSLQMSAQRVVRFSSVEEFTQEFIELIKLTKEDKVLFTDSLLPSIQYAIDEETQEQWITLCNNMLRKRITEPNLWEELFRITEHVSTYEEYGTLKNVLVHLNTYIKSNPSARSKDYVAQLYVNIIKRAFYDNNTLIWKAPYSEWSMQFQDNELYFVIGEGDIIGRFREDSTIIMGSTAIFYPRKGLLDAKGGIVFWGRVGKNEDEIYGELSNWNLDTRQGYFKADSAILYAPELYGEPLKGVFEERLSARGQRNSQYPKFASYKNDFLLPNVYQEVHFRGGLGVVGPNYYGLSPDSAMAKVQFTYNNDTIITLRSGRFLFRDSLLSSGRVEVTAHLGEDSIYHPYCELRFDPRSGQVRIIRYKTGLGLSSWTDTYHNMDINVDQLLWNQGTAKINLRNLNLGSQQAAVFESKQYFRNARMEQIAGLQKTHPLEELKNASYAFGYNDMPVAELIYALRMAKEEGERFLFEMSIQGFAEFDVDKQTISLTDRLFEYLLNWTGERDYDVIQFISRIGQGSNAQISLLNYDMDIAGVGRIAVSDSQQVNLYPRGGRITMKKDVDFIFDGRINAGLFNYWGQGYSFDYQGFRIDMPQIDSMRFKVREFNPPPGERAALVDVQTVLQDLQGQLLIDQPNNKSSREFYPEYPIFQALNSSFVYYDDRRIHNGIYDRSRFYMAVEPFTIDSLDNTTTDGLLFDATFHSADIFPVFPQPLKVMPDYSLGFSTILPSIPNYKGKGTFGGQIELSNKGLHAEGRIAYLQSVTVSPDILMFPDDASGRATTFNIEEGFDGEGYPEAIGRNNPFHWFPYKDYLDASSREIPFEMYGAENVLAEGDLTYGPTGLFGTGEIRYLTAKHNSAYEGYSFYRRSFESADQDFRVKTALSDEQWAFQMLSSSAHVDFEKREGVFDKNDPASFIEFPANQYMAYMDHAEWQIDQAKVDIKHNKEDEAYLVSTHPLQDSLDFSAGFARFDLSPSILEAFEVPEIDVADARILPDSGYVVIRTNAAMDPLEKSQIIANRFSKLHTFYDATTRIRGKYRYTANGMYDYLDEEESTWPIAFQSIKPDTSGMTIGIAEIEEKDEFFISPYFGYRGKVQLEADQAPMFFMGSILIQNDCKNLQTTWFDIASYIDPSDIVIELPENDPDQLRDNTFNGIYISQDSLGGHSNFLSKYADRADIELLSATGVLFYDNEEQGYVITTYEKLKDYTVPDPYLVFYNYDCELYANGAINMFQNSGAVEMQMAGEVRHDLNKDDVTIDAVWTLDAPVDKDSWEFVGGLFTDGSGSKRSDDNAYIQGVYSILGQNSGGEFLENLATIESEGRFPKELRKSLVMSGIELEYSGRYKSFRGDGKAYIQNIYNMPIFAEVDCLVEIKERRRGSEIVLYLDNGTDFFYIAFKGIVMSLRSSDEEFNAGILGAKPKDRSVAAKGDQPAFTYNLAGKGKIMLLKRRFGIKE